MFNFAFKFFNTNYALRDAGLDPPLFPFNYVINVRSPEGPEDVGRIFVFYLRQCQHKVGVALTAVAPQLVEDGQGVGVREAAGRHPSADAQHPICNNQTLIELRNHNAQPHVHTQGLSHNGEISGHIPSPNHSLRKNVKNG